MVSYGFPNVTINTSGQQYNNKGEKPSVILYTYINLHEGKPKQYFVSVWEFQTTINSSNMVLYGLREVKQTLLILVYRGGSSLLI